MADPILTRRNLLGAGLTLAAATASVSIPARSSAQAETGSRRPALAAAARATKVLAVEHITVVCRRSFDEVHSALMKSLPQLDPTLENLLVERKTEEIAAQRANGPKLWLFLVRDHGSLLAVEGRSAKAKQY